MKNKIKWGIIGCGNVVETKSGPAFNSDISEIYAVMRRDLNKARQSASVLGAKKYYDNIDEFLADDNIDAVYIATPPGLHFIQAKKCCEAKKITYLEKPFARNYEEACSICKMFKENNIPLYIAHYRRAMEKFKKIKQLLDDDVIGKVCDVDFRLNRKYNYDEIHHSWLLNPELSGGGKFYDIAPHSIDIIIYLFGEIEDIYGIASNNCDEYITEDVVVFTFKTKTGVLGTANFNCLSLDKKDRMIISGTKGRIEFSIHKNNDIVVIKNDDIKTYQIDNDPIIQTDMINEVNQSILLKKKLNTCSGEDALETYRVIDIVLSNYYNGRTGEFWNKKD